MFKSRSHPSLDYQPYYYKKKKSGPPLLLILLGLILSVPLSLILLEIGAKIYLNVNNKTKELSNQSQPLEVTSYNLKFLTNNNKPIEGLPSDNARLLAKRDSQLGYRLIPNQENKFVQINEEGFRDSEPISLRKPNNEIRIFILGGSTAFGQWNQSQSETISNFLETLLNQRVEQQKNSPETYRPDVFPFFKPLRKKAFALPAKIKEGNYRVINAAVPGYTSGNSLSQLALDILPYQPDLIIVLDGYGDLMLPSNQSLRDIPDIESFLEDPEKHYKIYLTQSLGKWLEGSSLYQTISYFFFHEEETLAQKTLVVSSQQSLQESLSDSDAELERRVDRYYQNQRQILKLSAGASIPLILAIQPEITGMDLNRLSPQEKEIFLELSTEYKENIPPAFQKLQQASKQLEQVFPKNVKVVNFYDFNPKSSAFSFVDPIHLNKEANEEIAQELYNTIADLEKLQIIPKFFYLPD